MSGSFGGWIGNGSYYEGSRIDSSLRAYHYLPELEAHNLSEMELRELWKKSHYLTNNNGVMRRLVNGTARYAVGKGLVPIAKTNDLDWNREAQARFDDWARNPRAFDVSGRCDFYQAQKQWVRGMTRLGDCFQSFTTDAAKLAPMIQTFEGSMISGKSTEPRGRQRWDNGVLLNDAGAALKYALYRGTDRPRGSLNALQTFHLWDPGHARASRGVPWAAHALTRIWDWKEIEAATTAGVKLEQMLAVVARRNDGNTADLSRGLPGSATSKDLRDEINKRSEALFGPMAIYHLEEGETIEGFKGEKPGERLESWLNYLVRDAAHGWGISPELAWSLAGVGGAPIRWILADGQMFFEEVQELLKRAAARVWVYFLAWEISSGRLGIPRGKRPWWAHAWITPQKVTVDRTKDGKLEVDLIKNALNSVPRYYAALGEEWEDVVKEQLDFLEWLQEECRNRELCMSDVIAPSANAPARAFEESADGGQGGEEDEDAGDDDDE